MNENPTIIDRVLPEWQKAKGWVVINSDQGQQLRQRILESNDPAILFEYFAGMNLNKTPWRKSTKAIREEFLQGLENKLKEIEVKSDYSVIFSLPLAAVRHIGQAKNPLDRHIRFRARKEHFSPEQLAIVCRVGEFVNPTTIQPKGRF
jgi:hypothetical protein